MTCDEVFNELSRTQRPSQVIDGSDENETESRSSLNRHLSTCDSCAQIAELFQPVVGMISSDAHAEYPRSARSMWQTIRESAEVANREATRLSRQSATPGSDPTSTWSRFRQSFQVVAVLLIGLGIGASVNHAMAVGGATDQIDSCTQLLMTISEHEDRCPTCQQPCEMSARQMTALCMACHVAPDLSGSLTNTSFLMDQRP